MFSKRMTHQETLEAVLIHKGSKNINSPYHALIKAPARAPFCRRTEVCSHHTGKGRRFTMHPKEFWALIVMAPFACILSAIIMTNIFSGLRQWNAKSPFTAFKYSKQWIPGEWVKWEPMPSQDGLFLSFISLTAAHAMNLIGFLTAGLWVLTWGILLLNVAAFVWIMFRELSGFREMLSSIAATRDDI